MRSLGVRDMDSKLKPYGKYKETEYDWLVNVPSHWQKLSIRNITELSNKRNGSRSDLELLSVYREYGVIKKSSRDDNHNVESEDLSNYKYVGTRYLVLNKMKMWQGSLGVSKHEGIVSPAYIVCKLIGNVNSSYINYLLRAAIYRTIYNRLSYGVRVGQWDMRYDDFKNIKVYIPPKEEQDQIVRYLDSKLAKINKFIKNKKKLLELLKEQKQAIINQAVTKGLDPDAKMKPSGVEWLGDIPEGWEVTQVGKIYDIELGKMLQPNKKNENDTLEKYLCALNIFWDRIDCHNVKEMWFSEKDKVKYKVEKGDLIVIEGGDVAVSCIWNGDIEPCYIQNAVHRVKEKGYGKNEFLYYWLKSLKDLGYIDLICNKATFAHFTKEKFSSLFIFIPSITEQQKIITYIKTKSQSIDKAIEKIKKEIDLITEYRTSLISNVVTGKVDVRNIKVDDVTDELENHIEDLDDEELF